MRYPDTLDEQSRREAFGQPRAGDRAQFLIKPPHPFFGDFDFLTTRPAGQKRYDGELPAIIPVIATRFLGRGGDFHAT